jgi:cob(I)alamin adenosyltransferase
MKNRSELSIGQIQVYTGKGKGKTTAALGLALRACGQGWKVLMVSFMKGDSNCGEVKISSKIPSFRLIQSGLPTMVEKDNPSKEDINMASEGFQMAKKALIQKEYDMIILDEINMAVNYNLILLDDVLDLMDKKPPEIELVLTGRSAHPEIVKRANLVSEILEIKHYYTKGIDARQGVEY